MKQIPSKESQREYYNERWSKAVSRPINQLELKRLISILQMIDRLPLKIKDEMKILDLGCGSGWLSSILSHVGTATGIELSSEAVFAARKRYSFVDFRDGDLFEVLTEKDTYDIVVSQEVIEHVEDQPAFINLVANSLKLGGHFIFTTPNAWTQAHRTQEEHKKWGLQPIENWIDRKQIKQLLMPRFDAIEIRSIIDGFGTTGIFRVVNSFKLRQLLNSIGLSHLYSDLMLKLDFGLHLVAKARRKI